MVPQKTHLISKDTEVHSRGVKDDTEVNGIQRKEDAAALISEKNRFQDKKANKRQRWAFYNDESDNLSRRHNAYQHIHTQPGNNKYVK